RITSAGLPNSVKDGKWGTMPLRQLHFFISGNTLETGPIHAGLRDAAELLPIPAIVADSSFVLPIPVYTANPPLEVNHEYSHSFCSCRRPFCRLHHPASRADVPTAGRAGFGQSARGRRLRDRHSEPGTDSGRHP